MKINIELDEQTIKSLIIQYLELKLGEIPFNEKALIIETKSKQNYRSEWEPASFRATYSN